MIAEELQAAGVVGGEQLLQEQPAEQAREHADGKEEAGPAGDPALSVERDAAARHDDVDMRVMGQRRAPGVQHGGEADAGAKVLRVGGDGDERLGRGLEQEVVDDRLVLVGDVGDRRRQREDDVIVRHRQQLGLALGEPFLGRRALALGAVAVAAGVVGDERVRALLAARDMPAESGRAAVLDGRHDLQLAEAHMTGIGSAPCRPMGAEDIRDLERADAAGSPRLRRRRHLADRCSSGLVTSPRVFRATRV